MGDKDADREITLIDFAARYQRDMAMAHRAMAQLPHDAVCIDIGAHTGEWLTYFSEISPKARHVGFEPLSRFIPGLREKFPNCTIHQAALSDTTETAAFQHVVNDPGWSGLLKQQSYFVSPQFEIVQVSVLRLDDVLAQAPRVDFIKVDVEGGEFGVFAGGQQTLLRFQPVLYFEHARIHFFNYGEISVPLFDLLSNAGFSILSLQSNAVLTRDEFLEVVRFAHESNYDFPAETNFIAAPRERLKQLHLCRR
jgi:FkbM family methyltransferase